MSENDWPKQRCTAHKKNGTQCKRWANRGMSVCNSHGGRAPQARRKAQQRLEESSDIAVQRILSIMNDKKVSSSVRLAAAKEVLDRANVRGVERIQIEIPEWERRIQAMSVDYEVEEGEGGLRVLYGDENHEPPAIEPIKPARRQPPPPQGPEEITPDWFDPKPKTR